jgi:hypothetical protein
MYQPIADRGCVISLSRARMPARMRSCCLEDRSPSLSFVTDARTFDGPVGLVGAGYIGHLFAQHFALAGCFGKRTSGMTPPSSNPALRANDARSTPG